MKNLLLVVTVLLIVSSSAFGQWGANDPRWFEDDATAITTLDGVADTVLARAEKTVSKAALLVPQSTTDTLFVGTGSAEILNIHGKIAVQIGAGANNAKLSILQGATTTDICANLDIDGDLANTSYTITGTFANAMVNNAADTPIAGAQAGAIRVIDGDTWYVILTCAASSGTGTVAWDLTYKPLGQGGTVIAD